MAAELGGAFAVTYAGAPWWEWLPGDALSGRTVPGKHLPVLRMTACFSHSAAPGRLQRHLLQTAVLTRHQPCPC